MLFDLRAQPERLKRFCINAGRVLFLSLNFEKGIHYLLRAAVDPRELIALYPELQVLLCCSPVPMLGSVNSAVLVG